MRIRDIAAADSRFFLKSEWGPASEYWPAVSFTKRSVGDLLRKACRPGIDFVVYSGTNSAENTKDSRHRQNLLSIVRIDTSVEKATWELIPEESWSDAQGEHAGRWPYSFAMAAAWEMDGFPPAREIAKDAYRSLGIPANYGSVVEITGPERESLLALSVTAVVLRLQRAGIRIVERRRFIDAPVDVKAQMFRMAKLIEERVARSGASGIRLYPVREALPSVDLQEMLYRKCEVQKWVCALCHQPIPVAPANRLLQCSADRVENENLKYDAANVQITHFGCNLARNDGTINDFAEWLERAKGLI